MLQLDELAAFLADLFAVADDPDDVAGVYRPSDRPITRLGLTLEPWLGLGQWARAAQLDALFVHRPWGLGAEMLPSGVGVVAAHRAFDARMTLGFNPDLASALDLEELEAFGMKDGRPIGMLGLTALQSFDGYTQHLTTVFGGLDHMEQGRHKRVSRVAIVGAMTDALVREAAVRRAEVYVTGQWRQTASVAVRATGLSVVIVGHPRSEAWALHQLARHLQAPWPALRIVLPAAT